MAEDEDEDENGAAEEEGSGGNKKKIIIFIVIGILLIGMSVGGTLFAVKMMAPEPEPVGLVDEDGNPIVEEEVVEEEPPKGPAIYYPLKPAIVVNFQARGRQRFLQADVSLMTREEDVIDAIEMHMPAIRNSLVLKLGSQVYEEMQTEEGRELLRQEALQDLQAIMEAELGKPGIERLLFTNMVMQ